MISQLMSKIPALLRNNLLILLIFLLRKMLWSTDDASLTTTCNIVGISCLASQASCSHWIIDTRAIDHLCNNLTSLANVTKISNPTHNITIPDGSVLKVFKEKDIHLADDLILQKILYVTQLYFNLISASKLYADYNYSVIFYSIASYLQDHIMKRLLPLGENSNELYYLLDKRASSTPCVVNNTTINKANLVCTNSMLQQAKLPHLRLCHMPFEKIKLIYPNNDINAIKKIFICSILSLSKAD